MNNYKLLKLIIKNEIFFDKNFKGHLNENFLTIKHMYMC